jgi:hypothetical protein
MPDFTFECDLAGRGYARVAGVDEAGRGPLAGPVAAAAPKEVPPTRSLPAYRIRTTAKPAAQPRNP